MKEFTVKTIYLIRHAQTEGNVYGNWLGSRSKDKLNEQGMRQAKDNVETLKMLGVKAQKIFASPTERALEHAEILQRHLDLPIEKIHSLTEINLGLLEDRSRAEGIKLVPDEIEKWETNLKQFAAPLGETALEAAERFYETTEFIAKQTLEKDIIIVAHGVVIKLFIARVLRASLSAGETKIKVPHTSHGSITVVKYFQPYFKFERVIENKFPDSKEIKEYG